MTTLRCTAKLLKAMKAAPSELRRRGQVVQHHDVGAAEALTGHIGLGAQALFEIAEVAVLAPAGAHDDRLRRRVGVLPGATGMSHAHEERGLDIERALRQRGMCSAS